MAVYQRVARMADRPQNPQQQAAEAWAAAEHAGYEVVEVDGARLDDVDVVD